MITHIVLLKLANPTTGNINAVRDKLLSMDGKIVQLRHLEAGIDLIRLATPTTDVARLPTVLDNASGFLYYVSVAGITGLQQAAQDSIEDAVARLKAATDIPVAVGFGVRTPDQAAAIARVADGVVVGSAIVELVGQHAEGASAPVEAYIRSLSTAIAAARKETV